MIDPNGKTYTDPHFGVNANQPTNGSDLMITVSEMTGAYLYEGYVYAGEARVINLS